VRPDAAGNPSRRGSADRGRSTIHVIADAVIDQQFDFGGTSSPEGAITLLLTDIERAAELLERLGEPASTNLLRDHNALVHQLAQGYGGRSCALKRTDCWCVSSARTRRCAVR
jgi:class 3 adenylate cyclase